VSEHAGNISAELQAFAIMAPDWGVSVLLLSALRVGKTPYQLKTLFTMKDTFSFMLGLYTPIGQHGVSFQKISQQVIHVTVPHQEHI
jgi:hypothetical protein